MNDDQARYWLILTESSQPQISCVCVVCVMIISWKSISMEGSYMLVLCAVVESDVSRSEN